MKLVFATRNPGKLREVRKMLPEGISLLSLDAIGCTSEIPETEPTLEGNAGLKARYVSDNFRMDCIADDTGLEVAALGGAPGVYSARYAGPAADPEANMRKLLAAMEGKEDRRARFRTVIALCLGGQFHYFEGVVNGELLKAPRGTGGFGYDPVFQPEGSPRSFAEFTTDEKNSISHRGKAFRALDAFLRTRV